MSVRDFLLALPFSLKKVTHSRNSKYTRAARGKGFGRAGNQTGDPCPRFSTWFTKLHFTVFTPGCTWSTAINKISGMGSRHVSQNPFETRRIWPFPALVTSSSGQLIGCLGHLWNDVIATQRRSHQTLVRKLILFQSEYGQAYFSKWYTQYRLYRLTLKHLLGQHSYSSNKIRTHLPKTGKARYTDYISSRDSSARDRQTAKGDRWKLAPTKYSGEE